MEMEERYGYQAQRLYERSIERGPLLHSQEEEIIRAREAVVSAREMAIEQGPDVDIRQVWTHALKEGTCLTTFDAVKAEMEESVARGEFIGLVRESQRSTEVTNSMTPAERVDGLQLNDYERESEIEKADHSLSARSLDQNSVAGSSQAGVSSSTNGDDSFSAGADELADDLEIENAIELGFGL